MKKTYPIVLSPISNGYLVYVPDFNINTEGSDLSEAVNMARDAIGIVGIDMEDCGQTLPEPSEMASIKNEQEDRIVLVEIDFTEYRNNCD